jgi:hypothetical protein
LVGLLVLLPEVVLVVQGRAPGPQLALAVQVELQVG